jgi:hypothetical protein
MSLSITTFIGDHKNTQRGNVEHFENFEQLAERFSKCKQGSKFSSYFVRGELSPIERKNSNLKSSKLIVIDGDSAIRGKLCEPQLAHLKLKQLGYNHFIYTSHSHSAEQNKFRIVIECMEHSQEQLKDINKSILDELRLDIKLVKEMNSWSQPWFDPYRDNPEDGLFEFYSYFNGDIYEQKENQTETKKDEEEGDQDEDHSSLQEMYENIRTGKEYHESLRTISYQLIKDGMSKAHTLAMLRTMMNASAEVGTDRWQIRWDDLERLVQGAVERVDEEFDDFNLENIQQTEHDDIDIPTPPGLLGKLYKEVMESMRYPDQKIGFVTTIFALSSIVGRKFNVDKDSPDGMVDPTALNMYLTLAANTGLGKDEISTVIQKLCFQSAGVTADPSKFFYSGKVHGVRPLYRIFKEQRSIGIVNGEAGIAGQSQVGDKEGMKGMWLNLYGRGHWSGKTDAVGYSSEEHTVEQVKAVAVSRISESTEVELFKAYNQDDVMSNGLVPRESVFRVIKPNTRLNRHRRVDFSEDIIERFRYLATHCLLDINSDDPVTHIITVKNKAMLDDMVKLQEHYRDRQFFAETTQEKAMSSRMFVKCIRYAGIAVAFNKQDSLIIDEEIWAWARKMGEYEIATIDECFAGMTGNDDMNLACREVLKKIISIVDNTCAKKGQVDKRYRDRKLIPLSKLNQLCVNTTCIKKLDGNPRYPNYKSGLDKVVEYLHGQGALGITDKDPFGKSPKLIKLHRDIADIII